MGKRSFILYFKKLPVTLLLTLVFLELGLRAEGLISSSWQEYRNYLSLKHKSTYRILCLGESNTAGQYPGLLEEILNKRDTGIRFSVIDKGRTGANTVVMLSELKQNLDIYKPDMVIVMAGCNDAEISSYNDISGSTPGFLRNFRVYQAMRLIRMNIGKQFNKQESEPPKNGGDYRELGFFYLDQGKLPEAEEALSKVKGLRPENSDAYFKLGWLYLDQGKITQAEDSFRKAIDSNPGNKKAYNDLGGFYIFQGELSRAEDLFKEALKVNPKNDMAYAQLGRIYQMQGKSPRAEASFSNAIELNPQNDYAYFELGFFYQDQGNLPRAEDSFGKALDLNPKNYSAYLALVALYREMGKPELAKKYYEAANRLKFEYYKPVTVSNYLELKEILDKRGIRLVCAQYPMRSVAPLKEIFENDPNVIFVDNEAIFKEMVKKFGLKDVFQDMAGGDFGHCTPKGNALLAENIARAILGQVKLGGRHR